MKGQTIGAELEFAGITRNKAAKVVAKFFGTTTIHTGGTYDKYTIEDTAGRVWSIVSDSSIRAESAREKCELVTPILHWDDIETLQEIVRELRHGTIEEWENFSVPFVLWDISAADEKRLDRYEGFPRVYQKHTVEVEVGNEKFTAMYYSKPETERVAPPCDHYVAVLWEAYEHFGFDLKILKRARAFACGGSF